MSSYIRYEVLLFFQSAAVGAVLVLCYCLLSALRKAIPHHPYVTACEDLIYWISVGFAVFAVIYCSNQGILRNFLFMGIGLGAWLCYVTVWSVFEKIWFRIFQVPVFFVKFSIKRLLFPVKRCKIFKYIFVRMCKKCKKFRMLRIKRGRQVEKVKKEGKQKENSE